MDPIVLRAKFEQPASNSLWTWDYRTGALFDQLPTAAPGQHPVVEVRKLSDERCTSLAEDQDLVAAVDEAANALTVLGR